MSFSKMSVGEAIVKFLDNQYVSYDGVVDKFVEGIFTIFGHGCVVGAGEALSHAEHSLKVYQGKSEQGMAHVAIAYAKQHNRRKILPCMSSIGPGSANMVTAAATATVNNIPLLLLCGDTFASRQPDPVLQQLEQPYDAGVTTNDAFKPVTRYFDRISRPEMTMSALINAMRVLTEPSMTGAVCLALPQDVQGEVYDFPQEFFNKRIHKITRPIAVSEQIDEAVELIKASKKPLVIVGGGSRYSEAGSVLADFAEEFNIPLSETQAGKSTLKSSLFYNLGGIGVTGNSASNTIAAECDLIIGVGTRFSDFTTASKSLFSDKKIISINLSNMHAYKLDSVAVVGDAKVTMEAIFNTLKKSNYKSGYKDEIKTSRDNWDKEMSRIGSKYYNKSDYVSENTIMTDNAVEDFAKVSGGRVCQTTAIKVIRDTIDKNAISVGASGSLPGCLQRMWTTDCLYSYNMEYGYSCMGYEIAGALGSKLASPSQEVYAMVGDGSFLMLHSEMVTAVQENKKINILLFDNGGFGCINNLQMGQGIKSLATEFRLRDSEDRITSGQFLSIDYAQCASAYGFVSMSVRTIEELKDALIASLSETRSVLIDIKTLPKSMTNGYGAWWNVGINQLPRNSAQADALADREAHLKLARKY